MSQSIQPYRGGPPEPAPRYEIVDTIASGDFATVYRARDRELGREVAVKAIHQQFLNDPRQLERYWREAQLLATLQHPNILTIYDIVRPRGWLIVELMRGSLARAIEGGPLDLDFLRVSLVCCLNALHFLHGNGVIHGDVKPSNMLVDAQGRVKLGDFGLARRASDEQGSLLKGTTKYMAPELVSGQFGPIGPASDLYSLGFACYELMCGPQFDSLFPGLGTFGRDRQIAWLMWHAAADRQLPPISRVLEGVPPDLAHVIERLTTKDQSRRYQSAAEVIQDLRMPPAQVPGAGGPSEAAPPVDKKKRLVRIGAIAAFICSAVVSLVLVLPSRPPATREEMTKVQGKIVKIDLDNRNMVVESNADGSRPTVIFRPGDKFFLNHKPGYLRDLKESDQATVETGVLDAGKKITVVWALRPETLEGHVKAIQAGPRQLVVAYGPGQQGPQEMAVLVPEKLPILFNGKETLKGKPVALVDLQAGDRVVVQYSVEEKSRTALSVAAQRETEIEGTIRQSVDASRPELILALGPGDGAELVKLPVAADCEVLLNGAKILDEKVLRAADLRPGDKVKVTHDAQVHRIDAYRVLGQAGVVQNVQAKALEVLEEGKGQATVFLVGPDCKITLAGDSVKLADLHQGDQVDIRHDTAGAGSPKALEIAARRPADKNRWAVVAGVEDYAEPRLGKLEHVGADARLLQETLIKRYAVPARQALLLADPPQARLRDALASTLGRAAPSDEILVYFGGHALRDRDGKVYLAPRDFNPGDMASTGVPLQWVVEQFEECRAKQKLLLLDACQGRPGMDPEKEPSSSEMFDSLQGPPGQAALRTVTGMASCSPGERGQVSSDKKRGLFVLALAEGLTGRADKNRDNQIDPSELFAFVAENISVAGAAQPQTPKLLLPDNRPPRLTAEAKKAIRALAAAVRGEGALTEAKTLYGEAQNLAGKEIEPRLIFGLVLLKGKQPKQRADALRFFEDLKTEKPDLLLPVQALAWLRFDKRLYAVGIADLTELMAKVPKPKKPKDGYPADVEHLFQWTGQLREFAASADETRPVPEPALKKLDAAVADHGEAAAGLYQKGREQTRTTLRDFEAKIESATDDATKSKLKIDRRQVGNYILFPFDVAVQAILAGLDR